MRFARFAALVVCALLFAAPLPAIQNISTRGLVQTGDNVLIGGFILNGTTNQLVLVRAIGPSLNGLGVANAMADPTISLFDSHGTMIATNDNWADDPNAASIEPALRPTNPAESAILISLAPGAYTAIVRGANNTTGVALVEAYIYNTAAPGVTSQHLYIGNDNTPGTILQFGLPLTPGAMSNFGIASNNVVAVALDANGDMAVADNAGHLRFFTAPLSASSTPAAAFNNGSASNDGQIAFMNTGDFWAATVSNRVNRFNAPFSNSSTPAQFVTDPGMVSDIGVALDAAQNLYIANAGTGNAAQCAGTSQPGGGCGSNLYVYAPPYTGAPIITPNVINFPFSSDSTAYRKIALTSTQLFVASISNAPGRVDVYNLPITSTSTPAFALTSGVNTPEGLAVDAGGDLYIGNLGDGTVTVYAAPITASSVPSIIIKASPGTFEIFGIGIGR